MKLKENRYFIAIFTPTRENEFIKQALIDAADETTRGSRQGYCEGCWSCEVPCDKMTDEMINQLMEEHKETMDKLAEND